MPALAKLSSEFVAEESNLLERPWLQQLTSDATLSDLPYFSATVTPDTQVEVLDQQLRADPELPGVMVVAACRLRGLVSRDTLLSHLSRQFGVSLYMRRPVQKLLEANPIEAIVLPFDCPVGEAASRALSRRTDSAFESVIASNGQQFRLVDVHRLLIAQSELLKLANETMQRQIDATEAANQAKSQFLANMSHEIRTPLTAIIGFSENLLQPDVTQSERTEAVQTILRTGHHLLLLLNDILDLSKIEAGRLDVERLKCSPGKVLVDVVSALRVRADARKTELRLTYRAPIPEFVQSDPTRLRQILINLVGNAIKFTERGRVEISVAIENAQADPPLLRFDIVDTGIGMTSEQVGRLFQPFTQADGSMTRRYGGTGLGLTIRSQLAQLLGGDISVTSEFGRGSTYSVTIETGPLHNVVWHTTPPTRTEEPCEVANTSIDQVLARVLLAEDSAVNQLLIGAFLRKIAAEVTIVDDGRKAVDATLAALSEGTPFDLILLDMQMPVLDGYKAASELHDRGWTGPILALTANAMSGDREICLAAGCDDFATKPINRRRLTAQIRQLIASAKTESQVKTTKAGERTA